MSEHANAQTVRLLVGNEGMPGAPLLHIEASVQGSELSGHATITQALPPPGGEIAINDLTGVIHSLGFGESNRVVALKGSYSPAPTEPLELPFTATLRLAQDAWTGHGSFSYGERHVEDVPVVPQQVAAGVGAAR